MIRAHWSSALLPRLARRRAGRTAETVVAGLSQNQVSITAQFRRVGDSGLRRGQAQRAQPGRAAAGGDRHGRGAGHPGRSCASKDRRFGPLDQHRGGRDRPAPSFYAVATTGPLADILSDTEDLRHRITIPRAIRAVGIAAEAEDAPSFTEALIRIRQAPAPTCCPKGAVTLTEDTLFRTDVALPANLTEGDYRVRIFLTRGGQVVDSLERTIDVRKEGLERCADQPRP